MHRLFTIEHLIHEICSHVPRYRLPVLARLSSTWFRCAISLLYSEFSTNSQQDILYHKFSNCSSDEDFKRLLNYTPYIREVSLDPNFDFSLLQAMRKSAFWGTQYIFPNVRILDWKFPQYSPENVEVTFGLISPRIEQLSLYIINDDTLHYICPLVTTRVPALHTLTIGLEHTTEMLQDSPPVKPVQDLLTFYTKTLTSVHITLSFNTPAIIECLSRMPNLRKLIVGRNSIEEEGKSEVCGDEGSFPSLRSFSFDGPLQSLHDVFLTPYGLASLTTLCINTELTPDDVCKSVSSIVAACPRIVDLFLGRRPPRDTYAEGWIIVPWLSLQPISQCKELTGLTLNWMFVSVDVEELVEFLKSRTTWKRFHVPTFTPLDLEVILLYAEYCPNLEHLRINIAESDGFCVEDVPSDGPRFANLTSIDLALSAVTKRNLRIFAHFLHRIFKKPPHKIHQRGQSADYILKELAIVISLNNVNLEIPCQVK